jgi:15-cis-phytoene desaturase
MGLVMPYLPAMLKTGVGAFSGGMTEVMCEPLAAYVRHRGGIVTTGVRAQSLLGGSSAITGVLSDHGELEAGHVVVATSPGPATALIDSALTNHPFFDGMRALPTTPTVSFQAETTRPLLQDDSPLFAPGTEIEFLAEQSRTTFPESTGRLSVTMAHPDQVWDLSTGELATLVTREAARVGIYLDGQILDARTVRTNDFYDLGVGHEHLRPPQHTPVPGLTLAGDYTRQRYLATMEGATFSGELAARSVLGRAT